MAQRAQLDRLFDALAAASQNEALRLSPEGRLLCQIKGVTLSFHHAEDGPLFLLAKIGPLNALAEDQQLYVMQHLLDANLLWQASGGGSFCLDPEARLMLSLRLEPPDDLAPADEAVFLSELLEAFVAAADWARELFWSRRLAKDE